MKNLCYKPVAISLYCAILDESFCEPGSRQFFLSLRNYELLDDVINIGNALGFCAFDRYLLLEAIRKFQEDENQNHFTIVSEKTDVQYNFEMKLVYSISA